MLEHRIRFRGGWEFSRIEPEPNLHRMFSLPVVWPTEVHGPVRLTRSFGRPTIDERFESTWLELVGIWGLRKTELNGVELGPVPSNVSDWAFPLDGRLGSRNTLRLDLVAGPPERIDQDQPWGSIALVIRPRIKLGEST